jgi:hypothetical protein
MTVSNTTLPGQDLTIDLAAAPAGDCA